MFLNQSLWNFYCSPGDDIWSECNHTPLWSAVFVTNHYKLSSWSFALLGNRKRSINRNYCINDILVYYADVKFYDIQYVCLRTEEKTSGEQRMGWLEATTKSHLQGPKLPFWEKLSKTLRSFLLFNCALTLCKHGGWKKYHSFRSFNTSSSQNIF